MGSRDGEHMIDAIAGIAKVGNREYWLSSELRQILDAIPALVLVAQDPLCTTMFGNRTAEELLRVPPGSNFSKSYRGPGAPYNFELFDTDGQPIKGGDLPVCRAARGEEILGYEFELRFSDGSRVFLYGDARPLRDDQGAIWGAVGAFVDISLRKLAERALVRSNAAKTRLLAVASHDLRQPIQGMTLLMQVLEGQLPSSAGPVMEKLKTCLSVLSTQLHDLLDLAKVDSGVVPVNYLTCPINDIIDRAVQPAAPQAAEKGLCLRIRRSAAVVRTDPVLLERLLVNLVANAVKYTQAGGILIGCRRRGHRCRLQVFDTGIGIPADQMQAIWSEFYQVHQAANAVEDGKGVGLGLAIVDHVARLLGCRVTVRSTPGKGSTFSIDLPLA